MSATETVIHIYAWVAIVTGIVATLAVGYYLTYFVATSVMKAKLYPKRLWNLAFLGVSLRFVKNPTQHTAHALCGAIVDTFEKDPELYEIIRSQFRAIDDYTKQRDRKDAETGVAPAMEGSGDGQSIQD